MINSDICLPCSSTINGKASKGDKNGQWKGGIRSVNQLIRASDLTADWITAGTANNVRRVGAYSTSDGYFFQKAADVFGIGTRVGSSDTLVTSFNGNLGSDWVPADNTYYKLTIEYTPLGSFFYVDGKLLHKIAKTVGLSGTSILPIKMENINTGTVSVVEFQSIGLYIARQGELYTNPTSKFIIGVGAGDTLCKIGAGTLKGIVYSGVENGAVITIYDNTEGSGTILWASGEISAKTEGAPTSIDLFGIPFSTGLTITLVAKDINVLVVYE